MLGMITNHMILSRYDVVSSLLCGLAVERCVSWLCVSSYQYHAVEGRGKRASYPLIHRHLIISECMSACDVVMLHGILHHGILQSSRLPVRSHVHTAKLHMEDREGSSKLDHISLECQLHVPVSQWSAQLELSCIPEWNKFSCSL